MSSSLRVEHDDDFDESHDLLTETEIEAEQLVYDDSPPSTEFDVEDQPRPTRQCCSGPFPIRSAVVGVSLLIGALALAAYGIILITSPRNDVDDITARSVGFFVVACILLLPGAYEIAAVIKYLVRNVRKSKRAAAKPESPNSWMSAQR